MISKIEYPTSMVREHILITCFNLMELCREKNSESFYFDLEHKHKVGNFKRRAELRPSHDISLLLRRMGSGFTYSSVVEQFKADMYILKSMLSLFRYSYYYNMVKDAYTESLRAKYKMLPRDFDLKEFYC
jgi:hypothetical protein